MGRLIDADKFLERVKKDREHEIYLHSWTADMVLKRLDSWYAPTVEAIPKDEYEARLKAILVDLQLQIEELDDSRSFNDGTIVVYTGIRNFKKNINDIIQQKINALKSEQE